MLVSLTLARGEVPVPVSLSLFLPEAWTSSDPARLDRAGMPAEHRVARTKPEIALAEIDRVFAAGVRFGCVLADAGYGLSAPFRQGLIARGLLWSARTVACRDLDPLGTAMTTYGSRVSTLDPDLAVQGQRARAWSQST